MKKEKAKKGKIKQGPGGGGIDPIALWLLVSLYSQ
jgi:hypothetical protein